MTPAQAEREARYWWGYAIALSRRWGVPPLYSREDWEGEALLGLAKALRGLDLSTPRASHARYIETVVTNHLKKSLRAVLSPTPTGGHASAPRSTYRRAVSMDECVSFEDGESRERHDIVPDPASPDPAGVAQDRVLLDAVLATARRMTPAQREAAAWLIAGASPQTVAARSGLTETTVCNRRLRARKALAASPLVREALGW